MYDSTGLTICHQSNIICGVAGMEADANILINWTRASAQRYLFAYNEEIPVEQLVQNLCDLKQGYTQYGGLRPFGVSFIFAGYDEHHGFQLYHSDPSGNYGGWKATCIGANNASAQSILKQDHKEEMTLDEAKALAIKVLSKTMDSTTLTSEKCKCDRRNQAGCDGWLIFVCTVEFATIRLVNEKVKYEPYQAEEIDALLKEQNVGATATTTETAAQ